MPGILQHIAFANYVFRKLERVISLDKVDFMSGNIIPDLSIDKTYSHYRKDSSVIGILIPDIERVKSELFTLEDSLKLGMYAHLYLDYYFIEDFLIPQFIWNRENMMVINPRNQKSWTAENFFSQYGIYNAYSEINHLLIRDRHIASDMIETLPDTLPYTGLTAFDDNREDKWKEKVDTYWRQKTKYTGDIFDYTSMWSFIEKVANQLVQDILEVQSQE